ncbi:MAG: heavy metal-binding domain-containing protein [Deltaproteobacteria bacterium]|nr:heavy metal-binding domain-containing protein [Deltaproteobacteria bacterium]
MTAALSELSVTEFLTLARIGFLPRGLVVGSCVFSAGSQYDWRVATGEIERLSNAMRSARQLAVARMRQQAVQLQADGIVDVRLEVEHHLWRGARQVAKCVAVGTAVVFDRGHAQGDLAAAPSLRLAGGQPFDSDLQASDFVTLLSAGYRPVTIAMGNCVYGLDPRELRQFRGSDTEITTYTQAFFDARELAMERLQHDLFAHFPRGHADAPTGIVGMTVSEATYGGAGGSGPPIVEFTAFGTAIAPLTPGDPRRTRIPTRPRVVVPLDR